jgi:hypothetical protein
MRVAGLLAGPASFVLRVAGLPSVAASAFLAGAFLSRYG